MPETLPKKALPSERHVSYREAKVIHYMVVDGLNPRQAITKAGFPSFLADHPSRLLEDQPNVKAEIERVKAALVAYQQERTLIDATELHEQLTEELRGDIADLYSADGTLLPIADWPLWARNGGVEVIDEPNMVRSADETGTSWDQQGRKITIRMSARHKTRELAMKHRGVNAMVQAPAAQVQVNVIDAETVQLATLLTPEQLAEARQKALAALK